MSNYAFGIDLGTTNSCIAFKQGSNPAKVITLADGRKTLPSCVMYKDGKVIVGQEAYEHRFDTQHVVYSSKRDIGYDKKYTVYANGDDKPPIEVTPIDVAAEILKKLKADAELLFGEGFIKDVTVTVPAYFTLERRTATIAAAKQAGLNVLSLINEPTSAALAYTEGKADTERILVYDLGGGTFDVTLLEMVDSDDSVASLFDDTLDSKMARVISSAGDPWLGGDDLDTMVYELALAELQKDLIADKKISKSTKLSEIVTEESKERAILTIEQTKKSGSFTGLNIPIHVKYKGADELYYLYVNEKCFTSAALTIFKKSQKIIKECLEGRDINSIGKLVLIGGSTKLQAIRDLIQQTYKGVKTYIELNPDEAVALGAAVNSAVLQGDTDLAVTDVLPQSLGIKITSIVGDQKLEGRYYKLISKNTPLPVTVNSIVTTTEPNQEVARIPVFQGEDPIAENNTPVGSVCLELDPSPETQNIEVKMTINASGILQVTVASNSRITQATIQNILNPVVSKKSKLDKFLTRYEITMQRYADTEYYDEGTELIAAVKQGVKTLAELQSFIASLPPIENKIDEDDSIPKELKSMYFRTADDGDSDDSDDDTEQESSDD